MTLSLGGNTRSMFGRALDDKHSTVFRRVMRCITRDNNPATELSPITYSRLEPERIILEHVTAGEQRNFQIFLFGGKSYRTQNILMQRHATQQAMEKHSSTVGYSSIWGRFPKDTPFRLAPHLTCNLCSEMSFFNPIGSRRTEQATCSRNHMSKQRSCLCSAITR